MDTQNAQFAQRDQPEIEVAAAQLASLRTIELSDTDESEAKSPKNDTGVFHDVESPLDTTDAPSRKNVFQLIQKWRNEVNYFHEDTWLWETISWIFSFGCLVAVFAVLWAFDRRSLPDFPFGISVGALVALFTTLSTTALMVPVAQGLCQLKWLHFASSARKVTDLEAFDQASRGVWGSVVLLFSARRGMTSRLGSLITVLVLAANAITQQAVTYVPHLVPDSNGVAAAPRVTYFGAYDTTDVFPGKRSQARPPYANSTARGAVFSGLLAGRSLAPFKSPQCSTGNCTWSDYRTLGVCSSVTDVSHLITKNVTTNHTLGLSFANIELPGVVNFSDPPPTRFHLQIRSTGKYFDGVVQNIKDLWYGADVQSISYSHLVNSSIADFYVVWHEFSPWWLQHPDRHSAPDAASHLHPKAVEVSLHFCVRTLRSNITSGVPNTEETDSPITTFEYPDAAQFSSYYGPPEPSDVDSEFNNLGSADFNSAFSDIAHDNPNASAVIPDSFERFGFSRKGQQSLVAFTRSLFNGTWIEDSTSSGPAGAAFYEALGLRPTVQVLTDQVRRGKMEENVVVQSDYKEKFEAFARTIAMHLSNSMRSEFANVPPAQGVALKAETNIRVTWPWVTLLVVLVTGSLVFLLLVIFLNRSRKMKLWRASNIALVQSLDPAARPFVKNGMYNNAAMLRQAKTVNMELSEDNDVWRLVQR